MHEQLAPLWQCGSTLATARANNWYEFVALLESKFLDWPEYIFRGQRDSNWPLRSKFDREYKNATELLKETDPFYGLNKQDTIHH